MVFSLSDVSPALLNERWFELANQLFQLQAEFVEPYKNLCKYRLKADFKSWNFNNLEQIPAIPTTAFKEFEITALNSTERTHVFYSSGTTYEKPSRHYHSIDSIKIYEDSLSLWFKNCILTRHKFYDGKFGTHDTNSNTPIKYCDPTGINFIFLTPPADAAPHSSLVHMFKTLKDRFGSESSDFVGFAENQTGWKIDFKKLNQILTSLSIDAPIIICGTAFNYVHLIDHLEKNGVRFNMPQETIIFETGGYKGRSREIPKSELYEKISKVFGIQTARIVSEYGMSELSSQAYDKIFKNQSDEQRKFRFPPWAKFSIVSPETKEPVGLNEIGILRIYDLANIYSVFAIQTDDLAINLGDGFMLVGRAGASEQRGCSLLVDI